MLQWSLAVELLAFIVVIVLMISFYDNKQTMSARKKIYEAGLWLTESSILLNVICVYTVEHSDTVPLWLNMILNSGYFLVTVLTSVMGAAYLFDLFLEHVYEKRCRTKAAAGLSVLTVLYTALIICNFWTGVIFYFDSQGNYHRGWLNSAGYMVMLIELIMLCMCYRRNRASIGKKVRKVIYIVPPLMVLIAGLQLLYPEVLLNGMLMSMGMLIIFVNFQNLQVNRDSMTGMGNRKALYEELYLRLNGRQQFQVILISLKGFDLINQKYGYRKGDDFLYHIAQWLGECGKDGRTFRFGNVTFALLCPYINEAESQKLLEKIEDKFEHLWTVGEIECVIPASFGMMTCREADRKATQVLELLNSLAELAKNSENGEVKLDVELADLLQRQKKLEQQLQDSLEKNSLEVWYQPIFNCREEKFDSAEAVVRMRDENGELVSPADFIPLAEKNGMIDRIGMHVLKEASQFLAEHPELPLQTISMNVSEQQFINQGLCEQMEACLQESGIPADRIKLEITERVILKDKKYMAGLMKQFSEKGFRFSIDDFGVGYSNFSSVMHLPFEFVKLDKSLLDNLASDSKDRLVVESMVELFHNMGLKVVAEGVETAEQQEIIRKIGADDIQGFYYAKPMPKAALLSFLGS